MMRCKRSVRSLRLAAAAFGIVACSGSARTVTSTGEVSPAVTPKRRFRDAGDTTIRVLLSSTVAAPNVSSARSFLFLDGTDQRLLVRVPPGQEWRVERDGRQLRAVRPDGVPTV